MERVIIFGGSGFIGKHVVNELSKEYEVVVISRHKRGTTELFGDNVKVERLRRNDNSKITNHFNGAKAVINLAGENVGEKWTEAKKKKIKKSRLDIDSIIVRSLINAETPPKVVLQGSAIGIYGFSRNTIDVTEETPLGQRGFLPKIAISHEEALHQIEKLTRVVYFRTGMVLDSSEGSLSKMATPFKLYLGGKLGNGQQWSSWIHIDDEINAIKYLLENDKCVGPYNLTAPNPVQNKEFAKLLGKALNRPHFMTVPGFFLRLMMGAMANELLLNGLKVIPSRLLAEGYHFKYENLDNALMNIYSKD